MSHADLLSRLEALTGPSREVDARIWAERDGRDIEGPVSSAIWRDAYFGKSRKPPHDECFLWATGYKDRVETADFIPRYTESLDAAVAITKEGEYWAVCHSGNYYQAVIDTDPSYIGDALCGPGACCGATPAIALLIAILRARETEGK